MLFSDLCSFLIGRERAELENMIAVFPDHTHFCAKYDHPM